MSSRVEDALNLCARHSTAGKLTYFLVYPETCTQGEETYIRMFAETLFVTEKKKLQTP